MTQLPEKMKQLKLEVKKFDVKKEKNAKSNETVNDLLKSIIRNPSEPVVFPTSWDKVEEQYVEEQDQDREKSDKE